MTQNKKIGIITYWESNDNYGQQLQCWALQHFLRSQGYDAFLIRQYCWPPTKKKGVKRVKQWVKDTISNVLCVTRLAYVPSIAKHFQFCLDKEITRRRFPLFRSQNLKMSKIYDTPEALVANPPIADVYITGSDQVWNYSALEGPLRNYFLQFGASNVKRISYAPSIGHADIPDDLIPIIKGYLQSFTAISLREASAVQLLKNMGYAATHVLDPTMLLQAADYKKLTCAASSKIGVFIYSMNYASAADLPFEEIKKFAAELQVPIIVTPGSGYLPAKELFEGVEYSYATIPQWLQHIANARLVVTASFHGIVFCILMHTPFLYTPLKGKEAGSNNRVLDLLKVLDLEFLIYDGSQNFNELENMIDWGNVDSILSEKRKFSQDFLLKNV